MGTEGEPLLHITRPRLAAAARLAGGLGAFRADLLVGLVGVSLFHAVQGIGIDRFAVVVNRSHRV